MKLSSVTRGVAAAMMLGGMSLATASAQDSGGSNDIDNELGVGFYLGNCDNLVGGAALFDLGNAELETENFSNTNENSADPGTPDTTLEDQVDEESSGDSTDVQGNNSDNGDSSVVVQGDQPPVWASLDESFDGNLADLVDAPFAVAVRFSADDTASEDDSDFIACGEFGGAVAGDEIIIPLVETDNSGYAGVAILRASDDQSSSTASVYLFNRDMNSTDSSGDGSGDGSGDSSNDSSGSDSGDDATPTS